MGFQFLNLFAGGRGGGPGDKDEVPHSRLFLVHGSTIGEDELRKAFKDYGTIENIRMVSLQLSRYSLYRRK